MNRNLDQNKRIWTAKARVGLNEKQFRLMVLDASGGVSRSTKDLSIVQAEILISVMNRMPRKHTRKSQSQYASKAMKAQLNRLGAKYPWKTINGFSGFLASRFGIEILETKIDRKKCSAAIEALKQMNARLQ